jgi:hypothetical protein
MKPDRSLGSQLRNSDRAALLDGQHGLGAPGGLQRIAAQFAQLRADAKEAAATQWSRLQGKTEQAVNRRAEAEDRRARLHLETQGKEPRLIVPLVMIVAAIFVMTTEAMLLRPLLDGWGIASSTAQFAFAVGIVLAWTAIVDLALFLMTGEGPFKRFVGILFLLIATLGLGAFGWWRREVLSLSHNSALRLLFERSPIVTTLASVVLTVVFPIASALMVWLYLPELEHALQFRRVIRAPNSWHGRICWLRAEQRVIEASLRMKLERLDAREREEREFYLKFYRLGEHLNRTRQGWTELTATTEGGGDANQ